MIYERCLDRISDFIKSNVEVKRKFKESVDISVKLSDMRYDGFRSTVFLPYGFGENSKIIAVVDNDDECFEDVKKSNNILCVVSSDNNIDIISDKKNLKIYDWCIATQNSMKLLIPYARLLSSKGLMPNVKFGTVDSDILQIIENIINKGMVIYKADKLGSINIKIANIDYSSESIFKNMKCLVEHILNLGNFLVEEENNKGKSSGKSKNKRKSSIIESIYLSTTMSKGSCRFELNDFSI